MAQFQFLFTYQYFQNLSFIPKALYNPLPKNQILILMSFSDGNWLRHFFKQFERDITQHPMKKEIVGNLEEQRLLEIEKFRKSLVPGAIDLAKLCISNTLSSSLCPQAPATISLSKPCRMHSFLCKETICYLYQLCLTKGSNGPKS